ncbi:DNA-3-methyladenine glycosylase 1 [Aquimixticola soesokkakensis]|uniref:DNA-3-methyladenine glycosylase I n=1 Tax=Aquimixticola soesokkakensis TaxID=1519096 RepID=A0A1Y5SUD1_9RHOB|nr:DNA-3-methyladenine glycosylase I [Aquimixticola soesokkakensis]SLN48555.1 DNA-3-methyladenine glycosylase 1 [Aquimixticola soesokkakensis]
MVNRCKWVGNETIYIDYHDHEWGVPVHDSRALWEQLTLESFQSGLSWITILRKRESFRAAFDGFDPVKVAAYGDADVARLLGDAGIVRHRGKIEATIHNARVFLDIDAEQGFANFMWSFVDGAPVLNDWASISDVPGSSPHAIAAAKALKTRGFKFCGPTTVYAFMQAAGLVMDHTRDCHCFAALSRAD